MDDLPDGGQASSTLFVGTVFLDVVLVGLPKAPAAGEEIWVRDRAISPGGVANSAVAAARLGARTTLVTDIGTDPEGDLLLGLLARERMLDLGRVNREPGRPTPITVALGTGTDRALVTHGELAPAEPRAVPLPRARTAFVPLGAERAEWAAAARRSGTTLFGGVGFDERTGWSPAVLDRLADVDVLVLNALEATAYALVDDVRAAARMLAERVPLVVVTNGAAGSIAIDAATGREHVSNPVLVEATDSTGAGDVFTAALMCGQQWFAEVDDQLRFAALCAALSVTGLGGAASAPTRADIAAWWVRTRDSRYHFLSDWLADAPDTGGEPGHPPVTEQQGVRS